MAVTLKERPESRRVRYGPSGRSETVVFNGKGSVLEAEYLAAVLAISDPNPGGPNYNGFVRGDIEIEPIDGRQWKISVNYDASGFGGTGVATGVTPTNPTPPLGSSGTAGSGDAPLGPGYSMEISAETKHITQSFETITKRVAGGAAVPDNKRAIAITKDKVEGCDVFAPKVTWTRAAARSNAATTMNYLKTLEGLVGKKNAALFYGRAAGEVVYMGASMQWNGSGYTFTHKFESRTSITNQIVVPDPADPANPNAANAISVLAAKGWDFIWFGYELVIRNDATAPEPIAAYVEKVIEDGDFSQLGIGA